MTIFISSMYYPYSSYSYADFVNTRRMFYDKCINMQQDNGRIDIICHPDAFHFFNVLFTVLFSSGVGIFLAVAIVSYFMRTDDDNANEDVSVDASGDDSLINFTKKYDEQFNSLPPDGYRIETYPFTYKIEENTPFGDIIMFLNVYKDDYIDNAESIEYTYYTQTNMWTTDQLFTIAKKIAIELNTRQFYKDKTIKNEKPKTDVVLENKNTSNDTKPETNTPLREVSPSTDGNTNEKTEFNVFAKFKKYNNGANGVLKPGVSNYVTNGISNTAQQSKMRRIGTIEEYRTECFKTELKLRIKNISFNDFKTKSSDD